ncbi:MAG: polysulfide reductase NrfD, partial [Deltaproteobacteria bacterium]
LPAKRRGLTNPDYLEEKVMDAKAREIRMWTSQTVGLIVFILVGGYMAFYRMANGLGAATNLNDVFPWGFWLGFDVLGGVAMAGGGFIIACAIYLFNWKKYKPIGRPAILTAFLGYLMAVVALFLDIGHPFRIWHPAVMWQVHSVMWVVAILFILYTTISGIESSPMLFKKLHRQKARHGVKFLYIGAVVFGVMLSTLHQSSLGAVFLISPSKMSPLWYDSFFLPYFFLVSSIAMGLAMVGTEAMLSEKAFAHKVNIEVFRGLARGTRNTLIVYLLLKLFFLFKNAGLAAAIDGSMPANMYLLEMALVVLPLCLLYNNTFNSTRSGILGVNILVISGVLVNRMNVCIFSMQQYNTSRAATYFPSRAEFLVTLGIVSLGILLFKLAAKYLPLFAEG